MSYTGPSMLLAVLFCAAISFLMSGMESGLLAVNRLRIRQLKRTGNAGAAMLLKFLERPEDFLWTILVGNTLANFAVVSYVVMLLAGLWLNHPFWRVGAFSVFVFVFYGLCELLPKMLFRMYPNRLCLALVQPFRFVHFTLFPIVALAAWFSRLLLRWTGGKEFTGNIFGNRDELRFLMQESAPALTTEEKTMINRVLDLQNLSVRHVVIPLADVVTAEVDTPVADLMRVAGERRITHFPVWQKQGSQRRVIGVVSVKNLLYAPEVDLTRRAGEFVRPALYVKEDMRLEQALQTLRRAGQRIAIVLSREQRELGIVTLQDILKAIFGEVNL